MKQWMVLTVVALAVNPGMNEATAQEGKPVTPPAPTQAPPASGAPKSGVIKENHVNLRAKASLKSDVITQLPAGAPVEILEEIPVRNPAYGEPNKWLRIVLPPDVGVWVHGRFIDPNSKAVTATRLNVRSGPSENHGIVGRINKGTVVKILETKGEWHKIEAPADTYAFVAAQLVTVGAAVAAAAPPPTAPAPTPAAPVTPATTEPPPTAVTTPPTAATAPPPPPIEAVATEPAPAEAAPITAPPAQPGDAVAATEPTPGEPVPAEEPAEEPAPEPPKRIVRREGIVRRTLSIQAPTEFLLENPENRRVLGYLFSTNIVLRDFYGKHIAVKGEEVMDERWKNTPVLKIEVLEPLP